MDSAETWNDIAKRKQQELYETLADRDWDCYQKSEYQFLLRNIGHSLFGSPSEEPNDSNHETGYNKKQRDLIERIAETIQQQDKHVERENKDDTHVAFIFIILKLESKNNEELLPTPVFRVPKVGENNDKCNIFIDSNCRVYMGWDNFLKYNKLPNCIYCYPRDGVYFGDKNDEVIVDFGSTPASSIVNRVKDGVDNLGSIVTAGSTIVSLAALAVPVGTPIILATALSGVAAGAYGVGRCIESIVDRKKHCQSIGLKNAESRCEWINFSANAFGMAAAAIRPTVVLMASRGKILGRTGCMVINASQFGCIATNGIGIINNMFDSHKKFKAGDATPLDVFRLSSAILFFTNSIVNIKTAHAIMTESPERCATVKEFEANLRCNEDMRTKFRVVRNMHHELHQTNTDSKIIKHLTTVQNQEVTGVQGHHGLLCLTDSVLSGLQSAGINISTICRRIITSPDILLVALRLAQSQNLHETVAFIKFLEFSKEFISQLLLEMEVAYLEVLNAARYCLGFNHSDFDRNYGINGDRRQHFLNIISTIHSVGKKCLELCDTFKTYASTHKMKNELKENEDEMEHSGIESLPVNISAANYNNVAQPCSSTSTTTEVNIPDQENKQENMKFLPEMCLKRDFSTAGKLLDEDIFKIAELVTGKKANKYNAYINYYVNDGPTPLSLVVIMDHNDPDRVVLVSSNFEDNSVIANELI